MKKSFPDIKQQKFIGVFFVLAGLAFGCSAVAQNYVQTNTYPVGIGPNNVSAVDVNGDGKLDLVSANDGAHFDGDTLTVLTNSGNGLFGSNAVYTVGRAPFVTAANLHDGGRPDLITANFYDSTVTVLTNNGSGGYGSNALYSVGNGPFNIVAADVDHDGKLDLITANDGTSFDGNTLTVLTNNGSGVFGFNATYTVGYLPSVTAADLRGTGHPDLITANFDDDSLTVLTNNGSGIFGFNATYDLDSGSSPINVVAEDVNNDTKLDLICANSGTNTLTVLTNDGDGTFTWSATLTVGYTPYVTAADANGDGKTDLVTANYDDDSLTVLTNNGSGIFGFNATYNLDSGSSPFSVVAADLNNDGRQELVSVNFGGDNLMVRLELPVLNLQATNQNATISWPPNWAGYALQQTTNVASGNWAAVNNPTGTNHLILPIQPTNSFFRLRHP